MNNLRRRKFNTYYWTCTVVAVCMLILSDIEWNMIFSGLLGATLLPFFIFDERGKFAFPDGDEDGVED